MADTSGPELPEEWIGLPPIGPPPVIASIFGNQQPTTLYPDAGSLSFAAIDVPCPIFPEFTGLPPIGPPPIIAQIVGNQQPYSLYDAGGHNVLGNVIVAIAALSVSMSSLRTVFATASSISLGAVTLTVSGIQINTLPVVGISSTSFETVALPSAAPVTIAVGSTSPVTIAVTK